ncbi:hypothetical protein IWQ60_010129 [Tieghemiomyces parasiticus]|uniref:oligopeptidase A n=1 Tax=Tieghemiomyces parasiticus TaxID=78921 RepID=A0A9W7ZLZ9_9FUNG|nr:hypothetical protein IWQ60_010129 [Tieghemiomyces parasiticus]
MAARAYTSSPLAHEPLVTAEEIRANPLLDISADFPNFASFRTEDVVPALELITKRVQETFAAREPHLTPTWEGTFGQTDDLDEQLAHVNDLVHHLHSVKNTPELRAAVEKVQPLCVATNLRLEQSKPLYEALRTLRDDPDRYNALDPVRQRVLRRQLNSMEQNGVALTPGTPEHTQFITRIQKLSQLKTRFANNALDATKAYARIVMDKQQLAGCSNDLLAQMAAGARKHGHSEATTENGPWAVTLDHPTYGPFMMTCLDRALRQEVYRANVTRATSGEGDNTVLIPQILALRRDHAEALGCKTHTELSLRRKMAPSSAAVEELFEKLYQAARPRAEADLISLNTFARDHLGMAIDAEPLQPWDLSYVSEQYRKHLTQYDEHQISQYLPFPTVLRGMFAVTEELFNVKVEAVTEVPAPIAVVGDTIPGAAPLKPTTWDPEVQLFRVSDARDGQTLAYFYGDFYSRPEEKNGGAWMNVCRSRRASPDGKGPVRLPIAYLICNQTPPQGNGQVPLMKFRDVETLFHEFGHCLQHMLTTVDVPQASGINGIEWDFVEVASQFMENFCNEPGWLARVAAHHETGEPMPAAMVDFLRQGRTFLSGLATLRQLRLGMTDWALHDTYDPRDSANNGETAFDVELRVVERTSVLPPDPGNKFLATFSHIFASAYDAGYYSYKWSEVYSADAYSVINGGTVKAPEVAKAGEVDSRKEMCQRYRDTVLSFGGGTDPREVWTRFSGRPVADIEPLIHQCGLKEEAAS